MSPRLFGLVLAALPLYAQEQPVDRGVNFYSRQKEEALGAQLAGELRKNMLVFDDSAAHAYVERLGRTFAAQWPGGWPDFHFEFVADPAGAPLEEPLVLPGGYVFVRAGLFRSAANEAEFAGMLAHSMAHAAARHGTRQATRGQIIDYASVPLIFMGSAEGIHGGKGMAVPTGYLKVIRGFEFDADRMAAEAMAKVGYDPGALLRYVERLQPETAPANSTLPSKEDRLAALRTAIAALPPAQYGGGTGEFARVRNELKVPAAPRREPPTLRRNQ